MIYNISVLSNIADAIEQALRTFFGKLSALIYSLIEYLYDVFVLISRAEFLDSNLVNGIYKKVGMILGIFMLFKLIFSLIQSLVEPEKFNDDKKGYVSIIKRSVIAIVLLGITPSIFSEAFNIQNLIIGSDNSNNVIYKLVVGESSNNIENMGRTIAANLYFSFYTDDEYPYYDGEGNYIEEEDKDRFKIIDYNTIVENVENKDMSFYETVDYLSLKVNYQYIIEFNEILSMLLGAVVAWMLVLYCIQAGTRVIQLGYLQLIAPIPILSYISDPEGSFKNWIKQCTSTYLDLFIRLAIIYFIMTILADVLGQFNKTDSLIMTSTGLISGTFTATLVKIFIVIGLLMFAKKVPELLKELFPNLGGGAAGLGFGLKSPKKMLEDIPGANKALGFTAGALAGGAVGLIGGGAKGFFGGFTKGAYGGLRGKKIGEIASDRAAQNQRNRQMRREGSTIGGRLDARFRNRFGLDSRTQQLDNQIHDIDMNTIRPIDDRINAINNDPIMEQKRRNDAIIAARKAMRDEAEKELLKAGSGDAHLRTLKAELENLRQNGGTAAQIIAAEDRYKAELDRLTDTWIDSNHSNQVVSSGMQTISNETGRIVLNSADVNAEDRGAKSGNATIASRVADLEHEKHELETQRTTAERQKTTIERKKEPHQANENAVKR